MSACPEDGRTVYRYRSYHQVHQSSQRCRAECGRRGSGVIEAELSIQFLVGSKKARRRSRSQGSCLLPCLLPSRCSGGSLARWLARLLLPQSRGLAVGGLLRLAVPVTASWRGTHWERPRRGPLKATPVGILTILSGLMSACISYNIKLLDESASQKSP